MQSKWSEEYPLSLFKRAQRQVDTARAHLDQGKYPECISCCIEAMELFLKCVSLILRGDYPTKHIDQWTEQDLAPIFKNIPIEIEDMMDPTTATFPRLFMLADFWTEFYNVAKYGQKEFKVGADRLFKKLEAELAVQHANECWSRVSQFRHYYKQYQEKKGKSTT